MLSARRKRASTSPHRGPGLWCIRATGGGRIDSSHWNLSARRRAISIAHRESFECVTGASRSGCEPGCHGACRGSARAAPALAAKPRPSAPPAVSLSASTRSPPSPRPPPIPSSPRRFADRGNSLTDFKFTPAARQGPAVAGPGRDPRPRRPAPRRARDAAALAAPAVSALTPASYNLGVAVGWRRFAVAGDVAKVKRRQSGARRPRERGRRRQLFAQQALHRPRRGRRRARRRHAGARARCARATIIRSMSAAPTR